jgi:integrase
MRYCQTDNPDRLLFNGDIKAIQSTVSQYLIHLYTTKGFASSTVLFHATTLKFFYTMNDVTSLNWKKIAKVLPKARKAVEDRPYTIHEISRLLEKVDQRGKVIILLMASSGIREGAIHLLKIAHLERVQDIYKITVYKNEPEEYFTFCSTECVKAIDDYFTYRERYGEIIKPYSPLIREQFNKNNEEQAANPRFVSRGNIENIIYRSINDAGIREKKNIVKGQRRVLHEVMQSHGLRKFFNTQMVTEGKMSPLYAEFLMGHKTGGLAMESYVRPTVQQILEEYLKAVDSVTINEEHKLRHELEHYKIKASQFDELRAEIDGLKEALRNR